MTEVTQGPEFGTPPTRWPAGGGRLEPTGPLGTKGDGPRTGDGRAQTTDGGPGTSDGRAQTVDGRTWAACGGAEVADGCAETADDGFGVDLDGPADALIRRLFAVGLDLHAALANLREHVAEEAALARIHNAIGVLDQAIKDVRSVVFAAHGVASTRDIARRPNVTL